MSLRTFLKHTAAGRLVLIPFRFLLIALPRLGRQLGSMVRWAFASKEHYNFTYDLTDLNWAYLASYVAVISGHEVSTIEGYMRELEQDEGLRQLLRERTLASPDRHNSDVEPRYGRRLGWYALLRATKPAVVLETGVDRGLGTAVMAAALRRNDQEGHPGLVYATDIVPACGHLLGDPYKAYARILLGDSVELLKKFSEQVDIFLHDSDHRPEYEWAEFLAIEPRLHRASIVMSDNSQQTTKMREFALRLGKSFLYFQDQPKGHWWPGDGIGAAFLLGTKTFFPQIGEEARR
ncbi:MAG TPA: class I SAM-dependent methyltransferase [Verrucomicrobiae bacterium]|nr:class I SAM-dependent methyltransferase [Verrucomicrobiae bacterium]